MTQFLLRRLLVMIPMSVLVLTAAFTIVNLAPGSPFARGRALPEAVENALRARYGLDQPRHIQYFRFMASVAGFPYREGAYRWTGVPDFGESIKYPGRRVNDIIAEALPVSLILGLCAYGIALAVGIPLGVIAGRRADTRSGQIASWISLIGVAVPAFVLGPLLIVIFSLTWFVFPPGRVDWVIDQGLLRIPTPGSLALPAIALAGTYITFIAQLTRSSLIDVSRETYIKTARAKGLSERAVTWRHAFRNALIPLVTFTGPALAFLVVGTVAVEAVFSIPGLGRYYLDAANNRDYFLILGITAFGTVALMVANLAVDIAYAFIDPRVRYD